jgi:thiosulfate/3-mercaptopyruvate sulfurtransferase
MKPMFDRSRECHATSFLPVSLILGALLVTVPARQARPDGPAPPSNPAASWKDAARITPEELAKTLRTPGAEKPALFQVGFRVLFAQAHIPESVYAGPGKTEAGLDALRKAVSALPKTKPIVLYCGCCPWKRCPNLRPSWTLLTEEGFTRVKLLYIPENFGKDWVEKGYPVETGGANRG